MGLILNIDTSSEKAHVSFAKNGLIIDYLSNESQKEHAAFLQSAIRDLIKKTGIILKETDAVAVTSGPGSYTGLRVGMASAKGICYALKKPLITLSSLQVLTVSALQLSSNIGQKALLCPMIDARRMEVFTAVYYQDLSVYLPPVAMILDKSCFEEELKKNEILFFGSGSDKWRTICSKPDAFLEDVQILPESMSYLSNKYLDEKKFSELAYTEPFYLKEFQIVTKK